MAKPIDFYDKIWVSQLDARTRDSHLEAHGQRVPYSESFTVGGVKIDFPGDPTGPPAEVKNCRCYIKIEPHHKMVLVGSAGGNDMAPTPNEAAALARIRLGQGTEEDLKVLAKGVGEKFDETELFGEDGEQAAGETFVTFSGIIGKLGVATSDRRILAADIDLSFREFPLPLAWCEKSGFGHEDSFTVGVVEFAEVRGSDVYAEGYWLNDLGDHTECATAMNQVNHRVSAPSLDLAAAEYIFTDENGKEIEGDLFDWWEENGEPFTYFTKAETTGFTLVQTPAFDGIDIVNGERESRDVAIAASVAEKVQLSSYDPALFEDPKLTRPTAPTMNNTTGRIYGHLAEWGHPIRGGNGDLAPRNHNDYANFHTSQVLLSNGKQLSVGRLTVKGGHAPTRPGVTSATARAHYDNVCTAFGLVRVGEDAFGIWFSGVPAPGVDPDTFQQGMTAPLSGDWRDCGKGLDMIGAHAVNSPGFPIYSAATGSDGREVALVASLGPSRAKGKSDDFKLTREALKLLLVEVNDDLAQRAARRDAELAAEARRKTALARAAAEIGPPPTAFQKIKAALSGREL